MDWWDDWSGWSNFGDTPAPEDDPLVLPTVTVVGSRIEEFDWFLWSLMNPDPLFQPIAWPQEDWASGGGGEAAENDREERSCSHSGPAVDESKFPANVDVNELRNAALKLGDQLWQNRNGPDGTGNEWVALILRGPTGNLITTDPLQGDSPVSVGEVEFEQYVDSFQNRYNAGYQIVGWVHTQSQPLPSTFEDSAGGGSDWQVHSDLRDAEYENFISTVKVADPNLVLYVIDDAGDLYEYTNEDENTKEEGDRVGDRQTDCQG